MATFGEIGGADALYCGNPEEVDGRGRWREYVTTFVEHEGHHYAVSWQRGLTEDCDNDVPDDGDDVPEVFPRDVVVVRKTRVWASAPDEPESGTPVLSEGTVDGLRVLGLGEDVEREAALLAGLDTQRLRDVLRSGLPVLSQDSAFDAYRTAVLRFLDEAPSAASGGAA